MELTEDEINEKYGKHRGHFSRNTLLPNEFERNCISCGFKQIKRKHESSKMQWKTINFINRLKYAEHKVICICVDIYNIHESDDYDKIYEVSSTFKKN